MWRHPTGERLGHARVAVPGPKSSTNGTGAQQMTTLLHVNSSPRGDHSDSLKIARLFLEEYRAHYPDTTVDTLNLFDSPLPPFGRPAADAKVAHLSGRPTTAEEDAEWAGARKTFDRFAFDEQRAASASWAKEKGASFA
jgi:hypothetical protein